jgi:hypothetical protein
MCWLCVQSITPATQQAIDAVLVGQAFRVLEAWQ